MRLFFINAQKDEPARKMLLKSFKERVSGVAAHANTDLPEWNTKLIDQARKANYVFILVSPAYFGSTPQRFSKINDLIHKATLPDAKQKVVAIIVRPYPWEDTVIKNCLLVLPNEGEVLSNERNEPVEAMCEAVAESLFGQAKPSLFRKFGDSAKTALATAWGFSSRLLGHIGGFFQSIPAFLMRHWKVASGVFVFLLLASFLWVFREKSSSEKPPNPQDEVPGIIPGSNTSAGPKTSPQQIPNLNNDTVPPKKPESVTKPKPVEKINQITACFGEELKNRKIKNLPKDALLKIQSNHASHNRVSFEIEVHRNGKVKNVKVLTPTNLKRAFKDDLVKMLKQIVFDPKDIGVIEYFFAKYDKVKIDLYFNAEARACSGRTATLLE